MFEAQPSNPTVPTMLLCNSNFYTNWKIKINTIKLNFTNPIEAYIPGNELMNYIIFVTYTDPKRESKIKEIISNNPFTKNANVIGPIHKKSLYKFIIAVSPNENKHVENIQNLEQFEQDMNVAYTHHVVILILMIKNHMW